MSNKLSWNKRMGRMAHNVYVIELRRRVLYSDKFKCENPDMDVNLECFYVGMTGKTPEERFEQHKSGDRSSRWVRRYGVRLRPDIYEQYNPMTYAEAVEMEKELTKILREKGHGVWSN